MHDKVMKQDELEPAVRGLAFEFGFRGGVSAPLDDVLAHIRSRLERDSATQWALKQGGR